MMFDIDDLELTKGQTQCVLLSYVITFFTIPILYYVLY